MRRLDTAAMGSKGGTRRSGEAVASLSKGNTSGPGHYSNIIENYIYSFGLSREN